jgi:hypothetical protein
MAAIDRIFAGDTAVTAVGFGEALGEGEVVAAAVTLGAGDSVGAGDDFTVVFGKLTAREAAGVAAQLFVNSEPPKTAKARTIKMMRFTDKSPEISYIKHPGNPPRCYLSIIIS